MKDLKARIPKRIIPRPAMGKQTVQAKEVYFLCYASALSEMTVTVQTFFSHPTVTATRK